MEQSASRRRAARGGRSSLRDRLVLASTSLVLVLSGCAHDERKQPIRVAAASDLVMAFTALGGEFERATGERVQFTFGSTGLLARQLRERAPFDMFAAASASFVDQVVQAGVCDGRTRALYGRGRIALWVKQAAGAPSTLEALRAPRFKRIAIANPEHAPYGRAARQALEQKQLFGELEPRIVYAENVRQALQYAQAGSVEVALVALSLVIADESGSFVQIDDGLHAPIDQELVACTQGARSEGGRRFAEYVAQRGRATMRRYGFLLPGERQVRRP